ncbi:hexose kinase [Clostridium sp. MCC353]|uniref:1-phosphofructokinase family hexose kinase n=1 Tax=Clostridium sp. MCC353 TaxID=2592646 RepID=UPI001C015F1D|nr:hexose kinase [Clostridium sp. MCC353]MBT9775227.1 hexose kinase [Clostridium sp. MCC353]
MIRVICLNPVIDRMYYIDDFRAATKFYEVPPKVYVGGKGINIARVMSLMGEHCVLYGFIGGGNGRLVSEDMKRYDVEFKAFQTSGETRTTINIIDNRNRKETEITEPGPEVGENEERQFLNALEGDLSGGDMVICSGIPMKGMSEDIYRKVSGICEMHGSKCILDATGVYLEKSFPGRYYFSKPNFSELSELFSITQEENAKNIIKSGKRMLELGVENLLISTGESGGIFLNEKGIFQAVIPKEEVVSTIGSGDASVAGFCIGVKRGYSAEDCVRLAMACGICNAKFSKVGYVEPEMVKELFGGVKIRLV